MSENRNVIRSIEEITASARMNMQDMVNRAIALGQDFIDAKEQLGHGKFLPWLKDLGFSSSTASNYMKVAREIAPGSRLAGLPYSKALALLAAPAEEREQLAEETEDRSAAEIRKLIEERNKAAEAANAETLRADQAEKDAKMFNQEAANLRNKVNVLQNELNGKTQYVNELQKVLDGKEDEMQRLLQECDEEAREEEREKLQTEIDDLRGKLLEAENNRVEVEVVPDDYEALKRSQADLLAAAAEAEERAAAAEEELENIRQGIETEDEPWKTLKMAVERFEMECNPLFSASHAKLAKSESRMRRSIEYMKSWLNAMEDVLAKAKTGVECEAEVV